MNWTPIVAVYAAIVATSALLWNIGRDIIYARRTVRLFLVLERAVQIGNKLVDVQFTLRVTNTSMTRDLELVSVDFEGGGLTWLTPEFEGGIRPATQEEQILPALLTPAKSVEIPICLSANNFDRFYATNGIAVEDSAGRKHRVNRHHLKSMQERVQQTAKVTNGEPYSVRVRSNR